jgi:alpha-tubulin suppressor-like RCC1 family protein
MIRCIGLLVVILSSACRTDGASPDDTNIDGTPDAPTATDVDATVVEDTQTNIRLEAISPDGDALSFDIASEPGFGTLILDGQRVEYTPDADYNGRDSFTFTATDPDGTSAPATVNITVTPVNDAPTARVSDVWRMAGQDVTLDAISTDADGDVVTREWRQLSGPTVDLTGPDPTFRVAFAGTYDFELDLSDGTETATLPVSVRVIDLDMSEEHVVAVDADGVAWAWGNNDGGTVGSVSGDQGVPVPVCTLGTSFPCTAYLVDVADVAAGDDYSLALLDNGTVVGWGSNSNSGLGDDNSVPALVGNLTDITAIATSGYHNLALDADGSVWSWGGNGSGQLGHGIQGGTVRPNAAAQVCVDFNPIGGVCAEILSDVVAITVSKDDELHSMAVDSSGVVWAWGDSRNGILGDGCVERGDCASVLVAAPVCTPDSAATDTCVPLTGGVGIAMGGEHAIALMDDGTALAWGDDNDGVLAQGCNLDSDLCNEVSVPVAVCAPGESAPCTPMSNISQVSSGAEHTLLLTTDGALYAVGGNSEGELGNGCEGALNCRDSISTIQPVCAFGDAFPCEPMTNIVGIRAGFENSFALTDTGELLAWGYNSTSMLGDGSQSILFARQVTEDTDWDLVEGAEDVALALKTDGSLWAWGDAHRTPVGNCDIGPLGEDPDDCEVPPYTPVQISDGDGTTLSADWVDIFAGYEHLGAVKDDSTTWLWGNPDDGALGLDVDVDVGLPTELAMTGWTTLTAGDQFTVGLADDGSLWAWGDNRQGQLGDGSDIASFSPVHVLSISEATADTDWVAVDAGDDFALAIKADGTLWAWGNGGSGQLASGNDDDIRNPTAVLGPEGSPSPTDWESVSAGQGHVVGIRSGALWAWGDGDDGRFGNGCIQTDTCDDWDEVTTPIPVGGPNGGPPTSDWMRVSAGHAHTLALRDNGTVYTFGENDGGSLGTGESRDADVLTPVCADWDALTWSCAAPLTNIVHISAAAENSFAIRDDGTLWAWGTNDEGRLGYGRPDGGYPVRVLWSAGGR